ncbi:MAG TPA: hypothetical protein VE631_06400, partial [Alphaproteobacteria bacterium]|nr:hypothetical protein [Alphaproteobacteria bacterium]
LGQYLVNRMSGMDGYVATAFDGAGQDLATTDFSWSALVDVTTAPPSLIQGSFLTDLQGQALDPAQQSPALTWLWEKARAEWS